MPDMIFVAVLTCPRCGHHKQETIPTDARQFFYDKESACRRRLVRFLRGAPPSVDGTSTPIVCRPRPNFCRLYDASAKPKPYSPPYVTSHQIN
jgi:hypothetical protein